MIVVSDNNDPKKDSIVPSSKQIDRQKEELTEQELLDLMGVFRDKYHRVNRRVKRK